MNINYAECPVATVYDFETVVVDVTRFEGEDGYMYSPILTFYKQFADDETGQAGEGMSFCTGIVGETIHEIHDRVGLVIASGFFGEIGISSHGTLYDEAHDEIDDICWASYGDDDDGCGLTDEDDVDFNREYDVNTVLPAPSMLQ
jgi:hypothetical protein